MFQSDMKTPHAEARQMKRIPRPPKLLSLDFDGVLHPSTDILDFATSGLGPVAYAQSRPRLFRWAPLLAEALRGTDCEILVHSSWRNTVSDSDLRDFLAPSGLVRRVVGSAPRHRAREDAILEVLALMGVEQEEIVVLDDAVKEFSTLRPQLIACNPLLGISDPATCLALRSRLESGV